MSAYLGQGQTQLLRSNQQVFLFQNATNVTGRASIALQLERVNSPLFFPFGVSFQVFFTDVNGNAANPGTFEIDIQESDIDQDSQYSLSGTLVNTALNANFSGRTELPIYARYIRAFIKTLTNPVYINLLATFSGGIPSSASNGGGGGMVWPPAGIPVSTGTAWGTSLDPANSFLPLTLTAPTTVNTGTNNLTIAGAATGTSGGTIYLGATSPTSAVTIRPGNRASTLQWFSAYYWVSGLGLNSLQSTLGSGDFVLNANILNGPPQLAGQTYFSLFAHTGLNNYQFQTAWNSNDATTVSRIIIRNQITGGTWTPWVELLHDDGAGNVTITGNQTIAGNAAASTSPLLLTGTVFTGGTGTTTVPQVYLNSGAVAPTTWNTAGTLLGMNAPAGFTGTLLDFKVNGGASVFSVGSTGNMIVYSGGTPQVSLLTGGVRFANNNFLAWSNSGSALGASDTNLSKVSTGVVQIGAGTVAGSNGTLVLSQIKGGTQAPALAAGTGAGTAPVITLAPGSSNLAGQISITTGTGATANAELVTATLGGAFAFANPAFVTLTPANAAAAALSGANAIYAASTTTTFSLISGATPLADATQYLWYYHLIGS